MSAANPYLFICLGLMILCAVFKTQSARRLQSLRDRLAETTAEQQKTVTLHRQLKAGLNQWRIQEQELATECSLLTDELEQTHTRIDAMRRQTRTLNEETLD